LSLTRFLQNSSTRGINIRETSERFDVLFDGVTKEPGLSNNLAPITFIKQEKLTIDDRLKLAFCGYVLGIASGNVPAFGRIIHGPSFSNVKINLGKLISRAISAVECEQHLNK
jgi:hypothetical protein